jgi:hypothetical protein
MKQPIALRRDIIILVETPTDSIKNLDISLTF